MSERLKALFLAVFLSLTITFSSFADVATPGNADFEVPAYQTFSDTLDAGIMPYVTDLPNIKNTVSYSDVLIQISYYDMSNNVKWCVAHPDGTGRFSISRPNDLASIRTFEVDLFPKSLPSSGRYNLQFKVSLDVGLDFNSASVYYQRNYNNANFASGGLSISYLTIYSDIWAECSINLSSLSFLAFSSQVSNPSFPLGGVVKVAFTRLDSSAEVEIDTTGKTSTEDIQQNISSTLDNVSSSVSHISDSIEDMSEGIGEVVAAVENLPSAMEPHFDNVLRQIQHVTDQLHAFWDQWASFMSTDLEPHITLQADRIIEAIENIHIDFGEFSSTIIQNDNKLHQEQLANDNKLHQEQIDNDNQNADAIMNSYDKSDMESANQELSDSLNSYQQKEDELINQVTGSINDFQFDNPFTQFTGAMADISYFLTAIYNGLGSFNIPIGFAFTLTVALLCIGWYRFKGA